MTEKKITAYQISNAYDHNRNNTLDALNALREARKYGFKLFQHEFISTKNIALHSATLFCISISCKNVLEKVLALTSEDANILIKEAFDINENLQSDVEFILAVSPVTTWD
ncbi:hypothetical protein [Pseudoalteromonas marina]|uniref:LLM class flavin-dependent oxidoreductase n=1 Tax=Pseudoalteromonas marina TaxID=267375 RepID=A0ABT9FI72_9GAMM|nr:hypothetical protein [Pseudoalteromonas marina]MDP2566456.1 hypothetical protein [Pseudoalteromonas marina]